MTAYTVGKLWKFGSLEQEQFISTPFPQAANTFVKELTCLGFKLYFLTNTDMIIPTKLWEETANSTGYVFSKLSLVQYLSAMNKVVSDLTPSNLLLSKTSIYTSSLFTHGTAGYSMKSDILVTSTIVNITPDLITALAQLKEFTENFKLSFELKGYRPTRKVLTRPKKSTDTPEYLLKRKLLVRDWFFFIVWYIRLKKALGIVGDKFIKSEARNGMLGKFLELIKDNCKITLRCQEINVQAWDNTEKERRIVVKKAEMPSVKIYFRNPAVEYYKDDERSGVSALAKEFNVTANYRMDVEEAATDSPVKVARLPSASPKRLRQAAEGAVAAAGKNTARASIPGPLIKASDQPKSNVFQGAGATFSSAAEPRGPPPERLPFNKGKDHSQTPATRAPAMPQSDEDYKDPRIHEYIDENVGGRIQSVVLLQLGAGYSREGVLRFTYLNSPSNIVRF